MKAGESGEETFVNGFTQCCGQGISKGRVEEQGQRFCVGLGIGAVAEMLGQSWRSAVDWDEPKSIGGSVASEDWFVFECDVDILVSEEVHLFGGEDCCAV